MSPDTTSAPGDLPEPGLVQELLVGEGLAVGHARARRRDDENKGQTRQFQARLQNANRN